jgi:hypothetical protein
VGEKSLRRRRRTYANTRGMIVGETARWAERKDGRCGLLLLRVDSSDEMGEVLLRPLVRLLHGLLQKTLAAKDLHRRKRCFLLLPAKGDQLTRPRGQVVRSSTSVLVRQVLLMCPPDQLVAVLDVLLVRLIREMLLRDHLPPRNLLRRRNAHVGLAVQDLQHPRRPRIRATEHLRPARAESPRGLSIVRASPREVTVAEEGREHLTVDDVLARLLGLCGRAWDRAEVGQGGLLG